MKIGLALECSSNARQELRMQEVHHAIVIFYKFMNCRLKRQNFAIWKHAPLQQL